MKMRKTSALMMTIALTVASLYGCGSDGGNNTNNETTNNGGQVKVNLKVWTPQEDQSSGWTKEICETFNSEHPEWDITFNYETCGEDKAAETITADPTETADVYMFANDQIGTLVNANAIAKLGGSVAKYVKETNDEKIVATVTKDGGVYGVPYTANTWFMYYDKSVFTDDDIKSLDKMLEKGVVSFPIDTGWYFGSFYAAGGATYYGKNGDDESAGVVVGENGTEVTKYIVNLVNNKNFVKDKGGSGLAGLRDKSVNAIFSGTWDYSAVKEILGDNIGISMLPTIKIAGKDMPLKAFAGSKAVGVNPNTKNIEVAAELALWMGSERAQLRHYQLRNIIPCNTNLLAKDELKNDILAKAQGDTIANTSIIQPTHSSFDDNFWDNGENMANSILDKTVTLDNADQKTKELEKAWNGK